MIQTELEFVQNVFIIHIYVSIYYSYSYILEFF